MRYRYTNLPQETDGADEVNLQECEVQIDKSARVTDGADEVNLQDCEIQIDKSAPSERWC